MTYPNTPILGLGSPDTYSIGANDKGSELGNDQAVVTAHSTLDAFAGFMTGSCYSLFQISGSTSDNLGDAGGLGAEYNRATDRVIQEVVAFAATSGSGGVTTIDILVQNPGAGAFSSIFLGNNACKVALSSSVGNYGVAKSGPSNMVSGSNTVWPRGSVLKTQLLTAAGSSGGSGQKGLIVQIFWKPSGSAVSYGA